MSYQGRVSDYVFYIGLVISLIFSAQQAMAGTDVVVSGLFNNGAIIDINGKQRMLRAGQTSPEGIKLISANKQQAKLLVDGQEYTLGLSKRINNNYKKAESVTVVVNNNGYDQFITSGSINGRGVKFLVDTGATSVALSIATAQSLGINYLAGTPIQVGTASGVVNGYRITLNNVSVGGISVSSVDAIVNQSPMREVLLGMSFLNHVEVSHKNGVLYLTK
jgi:aspartyl protease family protein